MCIYPRCMMGGGSCPDQSDCEAEDQKRHDEKMEQKRRDINEQEAKTRLMNLKAKALEKGLGLNNLRQA